MEKIFLIFFSIKNDHEFDKDGDVNGEVIIIYHTFLSILEWTYLEDKREKVYPFGRA